MRIAQIMAGAPHGGAELFFERLCIALDAAGETVLPVIRNDQGRAGRLRAARLAPVQLAFGGPLDWLTTPRLRSALREFAPDIAVSWMSRATAHTPRGGWVHIGRLGGYYDLRHYRRCDHLVGNTHGIVGWLRGQGWPAERSHYLPNFVNDLAGATPGRLPGTATTPTLLGLGRLHAAKGFDTLIAAMPRLPGARLVIAGAGPEHDALQRHSVQAGVGPRVQFLGWREDVAELLAACDIFVCSSRVEPLGNMVIEAWSAGRPVVACAADGPRELIRDGQDGLLVPRDDPAALAAAIRRLLGDPALRRALAQAGRARFEAEFSRDMVVERWRCFLRNRARVPHSTRPRGRRVAPD